MHNHNHIHLITNPHSLNWLTNPEHAEQADREKRNKRQHQRNTCNLAQPVLRPTSDRMAPMAEETPDQIFWAFDHGEAVVVVEDLE